MLLSMCTLEGGPSKLYRKKNNIPCKSLACYQALFLLRKEVIQPHLPIRLPCYDFTPVIDLTLDACLPCGLAQRLRALSTPMV